MLSVLVSDKKLPFKRVVMLTWYATKAVMRHIEHLQKTSYCPMKKNRLVDDSSGANPYQRVDALTWTKREQATGKRIKIRGFPKNHKVNVFRVASATRRTASIVTNDLTQTDPSVAQEVCHLRWKIEQVHREAKQVTGLEKCPCRLARSVRNHIACAFLVWGRLTQVAHQTGQTIYQVKHGLWEDDLRQQLKTPSTRVAFNSTTMELEPKVARLVSSVLPTFNRTTMELERPWARANPIILSTFN